MTAARTAWAVQLKAQAAARTIIEACARDGIDLLPVKGILTSRTLYTDIAERPMMDVDLRVRPRDLERAIAIARKLGTLVMRLRAYRSAIVEVRSMQVDLETSVGPPGMCGLTVEAMLSRASKSSLLGFPHLVPDIHDHALLLAVNVFKDKLALAHEGPMQDARRIVRLPDFDPDTFARRAKESSASTLGWIVADYMFRELGEARWGDVRDALGEPGRARYVRRMAQLERGQPGRRGEPGSLPLRVLSRVVHDEPSAWIPALFRMGAWAVERAVRGRIVVAKGRTL
jgi:hypothetical protein